MKVSRNDTLQYTRYYFGGSSSASLWRTRYELTEYPGSDTLKDTWFSASSGVFGFHRETKSTDSIYYVIKDHLGSIMTVAGEDGNAREFFSYDAWGRRRDASDWTYDTTLTANYTTRGYTGHEHIDETYLINMNGRVYDPLLGLFLSPDPVLQEPFNPLNYNRYSYVTNNPLKYTDPSGYVYRYSDIEEQEQWRESMRWWYEAQEILADAYYRSYGGGGGGYEMPLLSGEAGVHIDFETGEVRVLFYDATKKQFYYYDNSKIEDRSLDGSILNYSEGDQDAVKIPGVAVTASNERFYIDIGISKEDLKKSKHDKINRYLESIPNYLWPFGIVGDAASEAIRETGSSSKVLKNFSRGKALGALGHGVAIYNSGKNLDANSPSSIARFQTQIGMIGFNGFPGGSVIGFLYGLGEDAGMLDFYYDLLDALYEDHGLYVINGLYLFPVIIPTNKFFKNE